VTIQQNPQSYFLLSISTAVVVLLIKTYAFFITGSVSLLSDALETCINVATSVASLLLILYALKPPDEKHSFGHSKAEYFASGFEGALVLISGVYICSTSLQKIFHPDPLTWIPFGIFISLIATVLNGLLSALLFYKSRTFNSIALKAQSVHLISDVLTSLGTYAALILIAQTGYTILDPLIALILSLYIFYLGFKIIRQSFHELLDAAIPESDRELIKEVFKKFEKEGTLFHALRTRLSGSKRFVSFHVLVPDHWSVREGHALCDKIEHEIKERLSNTHVFTHLEALEDPCSWDDQVLFK
jgi:cation diffusion facilitator family transporter